MSDVPWLDARVVLLAGEPSQNKILPCPRCECQIDVRLEVRKKDCECLGQLVLPLSSKFKYMDDTGASWALDCGFHFDCCEVNCEHERPSQTMTWLEAQIEMLYTPEELERSVIEILSVLFGAGAHCSCKLSRGSNAEHNHNSQKLFASKIICDFATKPSLGIRNSAANTLEEWDGVFWPRLECVGQQYLCLQDGVRVCMSLVSDCLCPRYFAGCERNCDYNWNYILLGLLITLATPSLSNSTTINHTIVRVVP